MAGYIFISNSTKPTKDKQFSRDEVILTNVSRPCIETALDMGYDVFFGTNRHNPEELICELPIHMFDSHTYRSLVDLKSNYIAYRNMMRVLKNNNIEVIHCNTPIGGIIGRLCGRIAGVKKVIYTAHGFHFYEGAPLLNRTILKWAEQIMAHWTDAIITMNQEDYQAAKRFRLRKGGDVYFVHGVGIDTEEYANIDIDRNQYREMLDLLPDDFVCMSAGDLIQRKDFETSIRAIAAIGNKKVHLLICGEGPEMEHLKQITDELGVSSQIHFLGFRKDIKQLLKSVDCYLFTTLQEGMPRSLMEAMASGLPCVVSRIRGNIDLIKDHQNGFLCDIKDVDAFAKALERLYASPELCEQMKTVNLECIVDYDVNNVKKEIELIYSRVLKSK